jgi:hypothetical protein
MSRPDDPRHHATAEPVDAEPVDAEQTGGGKTDDRPTPAADAEPIDAEPIDVEPIDAEPIDAEIVETETAPGQVPGSTPVPAAPPAPGTPPATGYTDEGVPTLDYVRDKIEGRAATAAGWQELTGDTEAARTADEQFAERERKAKDRLEEIRRSMGR